MAVLSVLTMDERVLTVVTPIVAVVEGAEVDVDLEIAVVVVVGLIAVAGEVEVVAEEALTEVVAVDRGVAVEYVILLLDLVFLANQ